MTNGANGATSFAKKWSTWVGAILVTFALISAITGAVAFGLNLWAQPMVDSIEEVGHLVTEERQSRQFGDSLIVATLGAKIDILSRGLQQPTSVRRAAVLDSVAQVRAPQLNGNTVRKLRP